jgi:ankyrin repeat protein
MAKGGRPKKHDPIVWEIKKLIEKGENEKAQNLINSSTVNILDGEDETPLIYAALYNNINITSWLIEHGANANHQDRNGLSALHAAAIHGHIDIIKILLENGANVNVIDSYGNNPLWTATHYACLNVATKNNYKIIEILLENGSNPYNKNNYGKTPFEISERRIEIRELYNKYINNE